MNTLRFQLDTDSGPYLALRTALKKVFHPLRIGIVVLLSVGLAVAIAFMLSDNASAGVLEIFFLLVAVGHIVLFLYSRRFVGSVQASAEENAGRKGTILFSPENIEVSYDGEGARQYAYGQLRQFYWLGDFCYVILTGKGRSEYCAVSMQEYFDELCVLARELEKRKIRLIRLR